MNGVLLIQVFSIVVFFKIISAKNKDHGTRVAERRVSSTELARMLEPSVNLTKWLHKTGSLPGSSPSTTDAFIGREEVHYQPAKANGDHARVQIPPPHFFEAWNENVERQNRKVYPERREGGSPRDFRGFLSSFYRDKTELNRSPTYHRLLAKSMWSTSSMYPPHHYEGGQLSRQLSDTHRVVKQGERVPSSGLDPEENRPRKSTRHRASDPLINGINSPSETNRRTTSLLYHFNILREDYNKQFCSVECRKEKNEREFYCSSDFAINGIVHDIVTLDKGLQMVTLLVDSNGFYRMTRLYVTPDGFFFKVHILVVDTFNCRRLCPDLKFGGRYIMMGLIYHRRYPLPMWVQERVSGRLKPGDGLVKSTSYVRRFNKKRDQKVQLLRDGNCGATF